MKKVISLLAFIAIIGLGFYLYKARQLPSSPEQSSSPTSASKNINNALSGTQQLLTQGNHLQKATALREDSSLSPPIAQANQRVTKKPFGIYVTPKNSPVQPERFQGYHTGTDFEIFPNELNAPVPVMAICQGPIVEKRNASGYGGVLVQRCQLHGEPVTVVYGHLNLQSIGKNVADELAPGETIGVLGDNKSAQTDGERKHLHLSIHRGTAIDIRGYVPSQNLLQAWIDPCEYVCR